MSTFYGIQASTGKVIPDFESANTPDNLIANAGLLGIDAKDVKVVECTQDEIDAVTTQYFIDNPPAVDHVALQEAQTTDIVVQKISQTLGISQDAFDIMMAAYGATRN